MLLAVAQSQSLLSAQDESHDESDDKSGDESPDMLWKGDAAGVKSFRQGNGKEKGECATQKEPSLTMYDQDTAQSSIAIYVGQMLVDQHLTNF